MYTQLSLGLSLSLLWLPHETMVRSQRPTCRRPGPGGTRTGAAVVAIGVGCPVARLGAHGRRGGKRGPQSAQSAYSAPGAGPPSLERESVEV